GRILRSAHRPGKSLPPGTIRVRAVWIPRRSRPCVTMRAQMAVATTYAESFQRTRQGWIAGPAWDLLFVVSSLCASGLLLRRRSPCGLGRASALLFTVNVGLALVHSWSTTYLVIGSPLLREQRRLNPRKFLLIPLAIVAVSFALGIAIGETRAFPQRFP